jgi:hypothetical protein
MWIGYESATMSRGAFAKEAEWFSWFALNRGALALGRSSDNVKLLKASRRWGVLPPAAVLLPW